MRRSTNLGGIGEEVTPAQEAIAMRMEQSLATTEGLRQIQGDSYWFACVTVRMCGNEMNLNVISPHSHEFFEGIRRATSVDD
jgi:hypothetical protein